MPPSDSTKIAVMQSQMNNLETKVDKIDCKQDALSQKMDDFIQKMSDNYVKNEEFAFWRNLLVSGLLLTIVIAIIARYFHAPVI